MDPPSEQMHPRQFLEHYRLPEYAKAAYLFREELLYSAMGGWEPLIREIMPFHRTEQLSDSIVGPGQGKKLELRREFITEINVSASGALAGDYDEFVKSILSQAENSAGDVLRHQFQGIESTCEAVGQTLTGKDTGGVLTYDLFLDSLEKLEIQFDEKGRPRMEDIKLICGGGVKMPEALPTDEQMLRSQRIIEKKREGWRANRRIRRLFRED